MIAYKCRGCGGQMDLGTSGSFTCPYCGSKAFMSDADFRGHEEFRQKLLEYYKAQNDLKEFDYDSDSLWEVKDRGSFIMDNGDPLTIDYMFKYQESGYSFYVARESVVYVFEKSREADKFMEGLGRLDFPKADIKLSRCFPVLKLRIGLSGGGAALAFVRRPGFYPVEMFSPLQSVHLAWVISRMENICCALEYSGITHGNLKGSTVFINPATHEGALFGDWRQADRLTGKDLADMRSVAIELAENTREPRELYDFLNSKPCRSAFDDFAEWDKVIEKGFGGHKFVQM